ncbi:hypothetical protein ACR6HW_11475 [Fusibacter sp. JL298sf-3]
MIARVLEREGIHTITISVFEEMSHLTMAPRTLLSNLPFGAPFGAPHDSTTQKTVLSEALEHLLTSEHAGQIKKIEMPFND